MSKQHDLLSDAELVTRVCQGQTDAFAGLVGRHQHSLYRYLCGMGLDHDTVLDLTQDALVKAFNNLDSCREAERFRFWLFRIARNLCLDYLKNVRRNTVPFGALPDIEAIPAEPIGDCELQQTLRNALEQLPVALREAFLLKHDAEYTYDEIAELTGASPSAVKMRVHRAREALHETLSALKIRAA